MQTIYLINYVASEYNDEYNGWSEGVHNDKVFEDKTDADEFCLERNRNFVRGLMPAEWWFGNYGEWDWERTNEILTKYGHEEIDEGDGREAQLPKEMSDECCDEILSEVGYKMYSVEEMNMVQLFEDPNG